MAINRDRVLETAQKYVEKKKYDKAVVELRKLVEADPNDARTLLKIGDLQAKQSLYADAINTYESVGKLYANQGFSLKAIAVYKQIREIIAKHVPQLEERYGHIAPKLAELYQQLGLTSDALAALDEVATRLQRQQKDQEAIDVFRKIVELDPTNPLPHLRLAEALSRVKDVDGAVFEFKTAAAQLAGIGRRDDAIKVLERLLHHRPDPEQARTCAELYLSRGQAQDGMQALAKLQICFQADPRDFDTLSLLARAFNAIGQGAKAIEVQKEMARVARDTGKTDLFREILERLLRVAPHDEGVRRLAQQTGAGPAPGPYGAAMQEPPEPPPPRIQQPAHEPPRTWDQPAAPAYQPPRAPPQPYGARAGDRPQTAPLERPQPYAARAGDRPQTAPLERPRTAPFAAQQSPLGAYQPAEPSADDGYEYEEDIEELADAEIVEDGADVEQGEAYLDESEEAYADNQAGAYAEAEQVGAYADAQAGAYADERAGAYADARAGAYADDQAGAYAEAEQAGAYADERAGAYADDQDRGGGYGAQRGYEEAPAYGGGYEPGYGDEARYGEQPYEARGAEHAGHAHGGQAHGHAPSSFDGPGGIQEILANAEAFRRVRLYAKALETLNMGFELDPRSMELHEVYRDVLIESGQTEDAVQEMLVIAGLYVDALDGDSAARALQDVLAFDPENVRAVEMLQELGYEIVDESEATADEPLGASVEHDPRLPSYDLEEMGPADVSASYADERQIVRASQAPRAFSEDEVEQLPSFPLDDVDARDGYAVAEEDIAAAHAHDDGMAPPPAFGRAPSQAPAHLSQSPAGPAIASAASHELEDALDEAEFFCSRGLFDDARAILDEQLGRHPNNPLLRERLAEVDTQEAQRGSGAREKPRHAEDRAFDIAASLDALESLDYAELEPAEGHAQGEQIDVEEVFAKFKEGVAKQISADDSDSHYNLGIAYKEMLLLDDAIREFDLAAMDPKRECVCRSMIGMIHIERGNVNEAIEAFLQGLNANIKDPQQETVLCFEIGAAYEARKMNKDALSYYQKAMRRDPNYRDVQERVRRLAKTEPKQSVRQAAVGADDEFDRAFDDLLSKA